MVTRQVLCGSLYQEKMAKYEWEEKAQILNYQTLDKILSKN